MSRKLILASTITMVLAGTDASALGLAGLRTQSALNQPFLGEIELRDVSTDEIDSVKAAIASPDAFSRAGIERYYYLTRLSFKPEISAQGKPVIRVSSKDPIREPYMDFLVEVVWPSGQLVKEYTVLLDPPSLSRGAAPSVRAAQASSAARGSGGQSAAAAASGRSGAYIPAPGDGFPVYVGPVGNGDGLWVVARRNAPAGATVAQTAMALYRNNQGAFVRGNINRLIAGKTLVIPSRAELFALDSAAAESEYVAALRGRAQYRQPITDVTPEMLASRLRVTGANEAARAPAQAQAQAPVPGVQAPPPSASPAVQQDLMLALETSESTRQETLELRDRVKELESQLADIQALLQLRNEELARMQDAVAPGAAETEPAPTPDLAALDEPAPGDLATGPESAVALTPDDAAAEAPTVPEETAPVDSADAMASLEAALAEEAALAQEQSDLEGGMVPVPDPTPVPEETQPPVPQQPTEPPPAAQAEAPQPQPETSTWHSLLLPLAGLAGVTALGIMAFSWVTMRRRRDEEGQSDELEIGADDDRYDTLDVTTEPRSLMTEERDTIAATSRVLDETGSEPASTQTDDGEGESGVTMMSSLSNFDAETDEADILSEADIYIAYGRYSEAQDLLKGELKRFPDRLDVRFKLAESYAAAKELESLDGVMDDIQAAGGHLQDPAQWKKLEVERDQLRSGGAASAPDGAPALLAAEAADRDDDTFGLGGDDSFSLDISDAQRLSSQPHSADLGGELDLGEVEDTERNDMLAKSPVIIGDLGDSDVAGDSFGDAMTVAAESKMEGAKSEIDDSVIEMTLEEHKVEDVDDLDSIFDSNVLDEPTLARNEVEGGRPTDAELTGSTPSAGMDSSETGLPPDQESVPSDLLSSQWQIDSGIWDETATKLDLARAYIEMDDKDAAREILEEVVSEGRDEQRTEAQALLDELA